MSSRLCALTHFKGQVSYSVPLMHHSWLILLLVMEAMGGGNVQPVMATVPDQAATSQPIPPLESIEPVLSPTYDLLLRTLPDQQPQVPPSDSKQPQTPSAQPERPLQPEQSEKEKLYLVVSLSTRRVTLYRGEQKLSSYPIAIGRDRWQTPRGKFHILEMTKDPVWEHPWNGSLVMPGPSNPLGDRWMAFWTDGTNSIGFHGTTDESLIGQAVSHGCIRMKNHDVRSLFEQVTVGTAVVVTP